MFGNSVLYAVGATLLGHDRGRAGSLCTLANRTRFNRAIYFFIIMGIAMPTNFVTLMKGDADDEPDQHATGHHPAVLGDVPFRSACF